MVTAPSPVNSNVDVSIGGDTIAGVTNMRLSFGPTLVDVTELDVAFMKRFPTITDWTVTMDVVFATGDAGQAKIKTYITTPTRAQMIISVTGGHLTGHCWLESVDFGWDPKEVQRWTCTWKGSGALVYS